MPLTRSALKKIAHEVGEAVAPIDNNEPWIWLGPQHPLLNNLVLDTIFEHVKGNDLKACRLVCKHWNTLSIPFVRSAFQVCISGSLIPFDEKIQRQSIQNFINLMNSKHRSIEFENFYLGSFDVTEGVGQQFLEFVKNAKRLYLWHPDDVLHHHVEDISVLLRSALKLESLVMPFLLSSKHDDTPVKLFENESEIPTLKFLKTLDVGMELRESRTKICPTFLQELLSGAPNVSIVIASSLVNTRPECPSLEILNILDGLGGSVESLTLSHFLKAHLDVLTKMSERKPLKHLHITNGDFNEQNPLWDQFMELFKDNLIFLKIQSHNPHPLPSNFPRMSKLKHLELKHYFQNSCLRILKFEESFPVLETLKLKCPDTEAHSLIEFLEGHDQNSEPHQNLKSLILDGVSSFYHIFDRAGNAFPNLNVLTLEIKTDGERILNKIWTHFTKLQKLTLSGKLTAKKNIDSFFIGISSEDIGRIQESTIRSFEKMTIEDRKDAISDLIDKNQTIPSIRNLTNLRHLDLCVTLLDGNQNRLTDMTGYFGFYSLPLLRHLQVSECQFSKTCAEILVKDMELCTWSIRLDNLFDNIIPPSSNSYE